MMSAPADRDRMTVVIVDDSASALQRLAQLISQNIEGCAPRTFSVSADALRFCQTGEVDLIVVDYMMPHPDGLEFIDLYRRDPAHQDVPIIVVTAGKEADVRYKALQLGATDFLTKPVDAVEFVTRTRNLLTLSLGRRMLARRADWLAEEVEKATRSIVERDREAILILCRAAEYRDPETAAHLRRMADYAFLIASDMLGADRADLVRTAAPMHDIGKIGIPDSILQKRGRLTGDEMAAMRQHTVYGAQILAGSASPLLQEAATIALTHHERYDGGGYPHGLQGETIPLVGRIAALADVFDALTSPRSYKAAWPLDRARAYVEAEIGRHFDPRCVRTLLSRWAEVEIIAATALSAAG
jgi:putative two-component system response regulator